MYKKGKWVLRTLKKGLDDKSISHMKAGIGYYYLSDIGSREYLVAYLKFDASPLPPHHSLPKPYQIDKLNEMYRKRYNIAADAV